MSYNSDLVIDEYMKNKNRFINEFQFCPEHSSIYITYFYIFFSPSHSVTEIQFGLAHYFIEKVIIESPLEYLTLGTVEIKMKKNVFFYTSERLAKHGKSIVDIVTEHFFLSIMK